MHTSTLIDAGVAGSKGRRLLCKLGVACPSGPDSKQQPLTHCTAKPPLESFLACPELVSSSHLRRRNGSSGRYPDGPQKEALLKSGDACLCMSKAAVDA